MSDKPTESKTPQERAALALRLSEAATPGPWSAGGATPVGMQYMWPAVFAEQGDPVAYCGRDDHDAALIAEYRTLCPALAEDVRRLSADADVIEDIRLIIGGWPRDWARCSAPEIAAVLHVLRRLDEEAE